jgi:hypothetical protein
MHWQNGEWHTEDTPQTWDAGGDDLAQGEAAVAARRMRATVGEA